MKTLFKTKKIVKHMAFSTLILITAGCGGGGGSESSMPPLPDVLDETSLQVSQEDNQVLQGNSLVISVTLANITSLSKVGAVSTETSKIHLSFVDPENNDKFFVSYSPACDALTGTNVCTITVSTTNASLLLAEAESVIAYTIVANKGGKVTTTSPHSFTIKSLSLELTDVSMGSGDSDTLSIRNPGDRAIDMKGFSISSTDENISFSTNTCSDVLFAGESCEITLQAKATARSANSNIVLTKGGVTLAKTNLSLVRPVLSILPSSEVYLEPTTERVITVSNTSPVSVFNPSVSIQNLANVTIAKNICTLVIPPLGSCEVTLSAGSNPSGNGEILVAGGNADLVSKAIAGITPSDLLSTQLSYDHITTNSNANKQIVLKVENTGIQTDVTNLALHFSPNLPSLHVVPFLSSCSAYLPLLAGKTCQYVVEYTPGEMPAMSLADVAFNIRGREAVTKSKTMSINNYPMFYRAPQNTKRVHDGIGDNFVRSVYAIGNKIYVATAQGLSISEDGDNTWMIKTVADGLGYSYVYDVFASGDNLYVATHAGLSISKDGGNTWVTKTVADGLASKYVYSVTVHNNVIYAGTGHAVSISSDGGNTWSVKKSSDGLGTGLINTIFVTDAAIYVAQADGLSISTDGGNSWGRKTKINGLGSNAVRGVFAKDNMVYAATEGGLSISSVHDKNLKKAVAR